MRQSIIFAATCLFVLASAAAQAAAFYACGSDEIQKFQQTATGFQLVWRWQAGNYLSVSELGRSIDGKTHAFAKIDECKPDPDGAQLMITASTGGVAVLRLPSGQVTFRAYVPMAHSIERLPNGRVIVAASQYAQDEGQLAIFDLLDGRPLLSVPFPSAHGVVWDGNRQLLYAIGSEELAVFALDEIHRLPSLRRVDAIALPGKKNGHDISRLDADHLLFSTADSVWVLDVRNGTFAPYAPLQGRVSVKAVSVSPQSGRIVYQEAEEDWWSFRAMLLSPAGLVATPDIHLYKVRWAPSE